MTPRRLSNTPDVFETFVRDWALRGAVLLDGVAVIIVLVAALWNSSVAALGLVRRDPAAGIERVRGRLSRWLALALELLIGSDIIRTAVSPTWADLGQLAVVIAIRVALEFTLMRELVDHDS